MAPLPPAITGSTSFITFLLRSPIRYRSLPTIRKNYWHCPAPRAECLLLENPAPLVAVGRALMSRPRLLLMDEPSMGLSPRLVEQSFEMIAGLHAQGISMLIVEQNANMALSVSDRGYVLQTGRIVLEGAASELAGHEELRRAYLGR